MLLIFLLGLFGAALLIRQSGRPQPQRQAVCQWLSDRLATLPASRIQAWPLIVILGWNVASAILQTLRPPLPRPPLPSCTSLLVSGLLQYGMLILVILFSLQQSGHSGHLLTGTPKRGSARAAIASGLRGGVMMLLPVWLLAGLSGLLLRILSWPRMPQEALQWLASGESDLPRQLVILLSSVAVAPLVEETLFRGILLPVLSRHGAHPWRGLLLSSLLFASLHLHAPSFLPLFGVAIGCSLGFLATGHLLTPIVMHTLFNVVSLLAFYAAPS
jgi:membrane protease YdiL (CAAX protease family)